MKEKFCLIDSDILIFILKNNEKVITKSLDYQNKHGKLIISELTYYECLRGFKFENSLKKIESFNEFIKKQTIVKQLNKDIFNKASDIFCKLRKNGKPTGEFDLLIGATALINNYKLITNNEKHYENICSLFDLKMENWIK